MTRPIAGFGYGSVGAAGVRLKTGAPVAADSSTLTDANFPAVADANGGLFDCAGLATIWVGVEMFDGSGQMSSGTVTLDPLLRDGAAGDGYRWKRPFYGSDPTAQAAFQPVLGAAGGWVEIRVDGATVYPRISAVTGSPTSVVVLARPGQPTVANKRFQ